MLKCELLFYDVVCGLCGSLGKSRDKAAAKSLLHWSAACSADDLADSALKLSQGKSQWSLWLCDLHILSVAYAPGSPGPRDATLFLVKLSCVQTL